MKKGLDVIRASGPIYCFLLYPAHLISQVVRSHWLVCLMSAAPLVLVHLRPARRHERSAARPCSHRQTDLL